MSSQIKSKIENKLELEILKQKARSPWINWKYLTSFYDYLNQLYDAEIQTWEEFQTREVKLKKRWTNNIEYVENM